MSDSRRSASLEETARETMSIVAAGSYTAPSGARVTIASSVQAAIAGTRTYEPDELEELLDRKGAGSASRSARLEVTLETTQQAAHRLFVDEKIPDVAVLNFASAIHAGGGFLKGARAQEEDLARCSALYACLQTQTEFYAFHRMAASPLYSDKMVYSPRVPFFRVRSDELLEHVYEASVITAAAPNAGRALDAGASHPGEIEIIFRRRTAKVLALAEARGHRSLVLGAWGCGVFANDPSMAADSFGTWLEAARFRTSFDRVVFAVYDPRPDKPSHTPFAKRLSPRPTQDC
jgi:uncharacterized protein (TIGR02452 family)